MKLVLTAYPAMQYSVRVNNEHEGNFELIKCIFFWVLQFFFFSEFCLFKPIIGNRSGDGTHV